MPAVDLTPYNQPQGSTSDGSKFDNLLASLQSTLNGLDNNNFAAGKIFDPSKLMQNSAVDGDGLVYDSAAGIWKRTTDKPLRIAALAGYPGDGTKALFGDGTWKVTGAANVGTELDYAQITASPASVTATTEGTAVVQIAGNSVTYDGSRVKLEFFCPTLSTSSNGTAVFVFLRDTTPLGQVKFAQTSTSDDKPVKAEFFETPAAGAHTYKVACFVTIGNVTVGAGAGGSGNLVPAFIRVTKA